MAWRVSGLFRASVICLAPLLLVGPAAAQPAGGGAEASVTLDIGEWVPPWDDATGGWGLVRAGGSPDKWAAFSSEAVTLGVAAGVYDAYWVQSADLPPLLLAEGVEAAGATTVTADTGVEFAVADWVPRPPGSGWGVVREGAAPDDWIAFTDGDALLLPPGSYDFYWVPEAEPEFGPVAIARIAVEAAFGGLGLEVDEAEGGLMVVRVVAGGPAEAVGLGAGDIITGVEGTSLEGLALADAVALLRGAPGSTATLEITAAGDGKTATLVATRQNVTPRRLISAESGIRVTPSPDLPPLDPETGRWLVTLPADPEVVANQSRDPSASIPVAPGVYDIYWLRAVGDDPILVAVEVLVPDGELVESAVSADAGEARD